MSKMCLTPETVLRSGMKFCEGQYGKDQAASVWVAPALFIKRYIHCLACTHKYLARSYAMVECSTKWWGLILCRKVPAKIISKKFLIRTSFSCIFYCTQIFKPMLNHVLISHCWTCRGALVFQNRILPTGRWSLSVEKLLVLQYSWCLSAVLNWSGEVCTV